jgi:hypothetical protein
MYDSGFLLVEAGGQVGLIVGHLLGRAGESIRLTVMDQLEMFEGYWTGRWRWKSVVGRRVVEVKLTG